MTADIPYAEVIGDPIAHSKSPLIHKFWLERLDIKADYRTCHVSPRDLPAYIEKRHKIAMLDLVADPGGVREKIGAMNTIVRQEDGSLIGTNTDAAGFLAPIADTDWSGKHAIIIGAGGAARAVIFALKQAGIGEITIIARNGLRATGLLMQSKWHRMSFRTVRSPPLLARSAPGSKRAPPQFRRTIAPRVVCRFD